MENFISGFKGQEASLEFLPKMVSSLEKVGRNYVNEETFVRPQNMFLLLEAPAQMHLSPQESTSLLDKAWGCFCTQSVLYDDPQRWKPSSCQLLMNTVKIKYLHSLHENTHQIRLNFPVLSRLITKTILYFLSVSVMVKKENLRRCYINLLNSTLNLWLKSDILCYLCSGFCHISWDFGPFLLTGLVQLRQDGRLPRSITPFHFCLQIFYWI